MTGFPDDRSPAEIAREIDHTRAEIGQTLDALEHKLAARQLVEKGVDMLSHAIDEYEVLNRGVDAIRANPLPVALIGVGAAWLLARASGLAGRDRVTDEASARAPTRGRNPALPAETAGAVLTPGVAARMGTSDYRDGPAQEAAGQAADGARGVLRTARDTGGAMIGRAGDYAGDRASRIADQIADTFFQHPLLIGGMGALAGALAASLLPATEFEDSWLGTTGDRLRRNAAATGRDAMNRVVDVVKRSADAAADAAYGVAKEETDRLTPEPTAP